MLKDSRRLLRADILRGRSVGANSESLTVSNGSIWIPLLGAGVGAATALVAIRQSTITTTLRPRP
jgi:hypothetical protein